jgi:transcriptional regulator with XRE-family HTH domain
MRGKFNNIIKEAIMKSGKEHQEIAVLVGISPSYISKICKDTIPSNPIIRSLADCLGCNADELVQVAEEERLKQYQCKHSIAETRHKRITISGRFEEIIKQLKPSKEEIQGLSPSQRAKLATQLMDVASQLVRSIAS